MINFSVEKVEKTKSDFILVVLLILLVGIGLSTLFSSSYYFAQKVFNDPGYFFKRQLIFSCIGAGIIFIIAQVPMNLIKKMIPWLLLFSLLLIVFTFIPGIGREVLGARRWIFPFGISFQPSELVKLSLILYLSYLFSKKEERIDDMLNSVFPPLLIVGLFVVLIYFQNDFSTAVFILSLSLIMFFIARVKLVYFLFIGTIVAPLTAILLFTKQHRVERIISFLNPMNDPVGSGYQVIASQSALSNGGLWGSGLGKGIKKLGGLPEVHSDFIFAAFGEETGFIGVLFVIALFIGFAVRGYIIALNSKDKFGYYLAFGITTSILYQMLFNLSVVVGLVPATGIPLPFFSSGGSSILVTLTMCGLLLNISRDTKSQKGALL